MPECEGIPFDIPMLVFVGGPLAGYVWPWVPALGNLVEFPYQDQESEVIEMFGNMGVKIKQTVKKALYRRVQINLGEHAPHFIWLAEGVELHDVLDMLLEGYKKSFRE